MRNDTSDDIGNRKFPSQCLKDNTFYLCQNYEISLKEKLYTVFFRMFITGYYRNFWVCHITSVSTETLFHLIVYYTNISLYLIFNCIMLTAQEKQFNIEWTNTTLKEKKSIFLICIYSVQYKNISSLFGKAFLTEKQGLIIAFFTFFTVKLNCMIFPFLHFFLFSFFSLSFNIFSLTLFLPSVHIYPCSIHSHISMFFPLHLCQ